MSKDWTNVRDAIRLSESLEQFGLGPASLRDTDVARRKEKIVAELPEYQKLFEKYRADPRVVILTINNDRNPDEVRPWMAQKQYTFPVLIDNRFVDQTGIQSFPTTWFLDPQGRKAYEKVGWSEKLLEEFGWRIEALKAADAGKR